MGDTINYILFRLAALTNETKRKKKFFLSPTASVSLQNPKHKSHPVVVTANSTAGSNTFEGELAQSRLHVS